MGGSRLPRKIPGRTMLPDVLKEKKKVSDSQGKGVYGREEREWDRSFVYKSSA
jgi:hypothetical protein